MRLSTESGFSPGSLHRELARHVVRVRESLHRELARQVVRVRGVGRA